MDPNQEPFSAADFAGTPLLEAIEKLAAEQQVSLATFETLSMGQVVQRAKDHYGEDLPEIWRIWIDWNDGDSVQPMGDL